MNSVEGHLKQSAHKLDTFASQDTYAYSAPEVCGVKNKPTRVADTYALGILCTAPTPLPLSPSYGATTASR
jgi:serine/threonine protein kinase